MQAFCLLTPNYIRLSLNFSHAGKMLLFSIILMDIKKKRTYSVFRSSSSFSFFYLVQLLVIYHSNGINSNEIITNNIIQLLKKINVNKYSLTMLIECFLFNELIPMLHLQWESIISWIDVLK